MRADARLLGAALGISLLVNLFLGGAVAGRWLAPKSVQPASAGGLAPGDEVRRLPAPDRLAFARAMLPHRPAIRAARQAVREARARVEDDMAAPRYDAARTAADLAALRTATAAQQAAVHGALAQALGQVSSASRAALAERVRDRRGRAAGAPGVGNAGPGR